MWVEEHWQQIGFIAATAFQLGALYAGFHGINKRLDRLNGQVDSHDDRLGTHGERIATIEGGR
jgi:hypothetical protein